MKQKRISLIFTLIVLVLVAGIAALSTWKRSPKADSVTDAEFGDYQLTLKSHTGKPLEGAYVVLTQTNTNPWPINTSFSGELARVDTGGTASFYNLPEATYHVSIYGADDSQIVIGDIDKFITIKKGETTTDSLAELIWPPNEPPLVEILEPATDTTVILGDATQFRYSIINEEQDDSVSAKMYFIKNGEAAPGRTLPGSCAQLTTGGPRTCTLNTQTLTAADLGTYTYYITAKDQVNNPIFAKGKGKLTLSPLPTFESPVISAVERISNTSVDILFTGPGAATTGVKSFRIERSTSPTSGYTSIGTVAVSTGTSYLYNDRDSVVRNATNGTFYYRVTTLGTINAKSIESAPSVVKSISLFALQAPTNLVLSKNTDNEVTATWTDTSSDETGFFIYRGTNASGPFTKIATRPGSNNTGNRTYVDSLPDPNTTGPHYYKVVAYKTLNGEDKKSAPTGPTLITLIGATKPSAPTNLRVNRVNNTKLRLRWNDTASNNSGYEILRSVDNITFTKVVEIGDTTTHTDTGLKNGTRYYYKVRAYRTVKNINVYSSDSNTQDARP